MLNCPDGECIGPSLQWTIFNLQSSDERRLLEFFEHYNAVMAPWMF